MLTLLLAQNGDTALMLACANEQEAAAGELMEATKLAGALDQLALYGHKKSALHIASEKGLAGTVAKLLALGADATLTDKVRARAVYRYPHVLICRLMYVCVCVCLCVCVCVCVCIHRLFSPYLIHDIRIHVHNA